jgi:GTP cyclohydrolase I
MKTVDKERIQKAFREILFAIGEDPDRDGLLETPRRVAEMYEEVFGEGGQDPHKVLETTFEDEHREVVLVKDIPFYSMCEHHFLPFFGKAHVAYIPKGRIVGISKLARVVESYARRPQVQERMTSQIADVVDEVLDASGVAVVTEAIHTCMTMRGIRKPGTSVITSAMRGLFRERIATRSEVMSLIMGHATPEIH